MFDDDKTGIKLAIGAGGGVFAMLLALMLPFMFLVVIFGGSDIQRSDAAHMDAGSSMEDIHFSDGVVDVVYYNQADSRYGSKPYGTDDIATYGCGPTSMAIVISSLTSDRQDPAQMANWAYQHGYWCSKSGSYRSLIPGAAQAWGLSVSGCRKKESQRIVDALTEGKLVVAIMNKGHFTQSGHFIVLRGVTADGKIMVADPASWRRSETLWDLSLIVKEASNNTSEGGPFWIIGAQ